MPFDFVNMRKRDSGLALRIWWEEIPLPTAMPGLMTIKEDLIEFPRPYVACRRDWVERYSNCEAPHLSTQSPPTKAAFERFIYSEASLQPPEDIIASAQGLWATDA